ncbi:MAG: hypothetical protein QMD14_04525 [Candidatus Aenigmarchaeota archaeon]|nr:hypothetical protein [Candidatus Aenigmarchaeota archaeon]
MNRVKYLLGVSNSQNPDIRIIAYYVALALQRMTDWLATEK